MYNLKDREEQFYRELISEISRIILKKDFIKLKKDLTKQYKKAKIKDAESAALEDALIAFLSKKLEDI
ncbi:hypothetical protein [Carboxydothermus ferrireducens]|uniref:Uncharacterized protein n=1 Tax=Carboxydothermus ferrireducens DSM 11255 TaxID=1119529 RepID=A0ABX2RF84_9THEO|nr:hypothetical protein [Carboxydothermus ferrireducens]NYE58463.1 hypothetical protein [Carboxydothermus ferrireducens DSM 11255]